jgi:hypothetical protein
VAVPAARQRGQEPLRHLHRRERSRYRTRRRSPVSAVTRPAAVPSRILPGRPGGVFPAFGEMFEGAWPPRRAWLPAGRDGSFVDEIQTAGKQFARAAKRLWRLRHGGITEADDG